MHWSSSYVGLPWRERGAARDGVACWGLVALVYREVLSLDVPDYAAVVTSVRERAQIASAFAAGTATDGPWRRVERPQPFDVLVFRRAGLDAHVGIAVDAARMIHVTQGRDSAMERFTDGRWAPRLSAVYRHAALLGASHGA